MSAPLAVPNAHAEERPPGRLRDRAVRGPAADGGVLSRTVRLPRGNRAANGRRAGRRLGHALPAEADAALRRPLGGAGLAGRADRLSRAFWRRGSLLRATPATGRGHS